MKSTTHFDKNKKGLECLNCGQPLLNDENFCSYCGQVNDELPLSLKQFVSEFFAGFLSFDTRFIKTIVPLLFKPGKVSKEYINGKRRKYTNPFKMYLHTSIVFFLIASLLSAITRITKIDKKEVDYHIVIDSIYNTLEKNSFNTEEIHFVTTYYKNLDSVFKYSNSLILFKNDSISKEIKDSLYIQLYEIGMNSKLPDLNINTTDREELELENEIEERIYKKVVRSKLEIYLASKGIKYKPEKNLSKNYNYKKILQLTGNKFGKFVIFSKEHKKISPVDALDSLGFKKTRMNLFKYQKGQELNRIVEDDDFRVSYLNSIISKISIALFFLLPLFTLVFSLLYIRHPYNYTEHLVVVFSLQTVYFLMLILSVILDAIFKTDFFAPIFHVVFLFYIYRTLKNFYEQNHFKTFLKFIAFSFFYVILAILGFVSISFLVFLV